MGPSPRQILKEVFEIAYLYIHLGVTKLGETEAFVVWKTSQVVLILGIRITDLSIYSCTSKI